MPDLTMADEDIDLARTAEPPNPSLLLNHIDDIPSMLMDFVASIPDRGVLAYLFVLAMISGAAIVWMVAR